VVIFLALLLERGLPGREAIESRSLVCRELGETDAMTLDPTIYQCPEHHTDLTDLVTEALEEEGPPVAYFGLRKAATARPFLVIVTCPGANGTGTHRLTCTGTRTQ
jgi:hypothetical protein